MDDILSYQGAMSLGATSDLEYDQQSIERKCSALQRENDYLKQQLLESEQMNQTLQAKIESLNELEEDNICLRLEIDLLKTDSEKTETAIQCDLFSSSSSDNSNSKHYDSIDGLASPLDTQGSDKLVTAFSGGLNEFQASRNEWEQYIEEPDWNDGKTSCCGKGSIVVYAGAMDEENAHRAAVVDLANKTITELANLPVKMSAPGIAIDDGYVIVVGFFDGFSDEGEQGSKMFKLSLEKPDVWEEMGRLPYDVEFCVLLTDAECIYAFGGYDRTSAYAYSKASQFWRHLADLPEACDSLRGGGFLQGGHIFLMSKISSMSYNIAENRWLQKKYKRINVDRIACVMYNGRILTNIDYQKNHTMYFYDFNSNSFLFMTNNCGNTYTFFSLNY